MALPHVFAPIKSQDFTLRPTTVHKKFVIQKSDLYSGSLPQTGSGYKIWEANYIGEHLKLGTESTYPTNSFDGTYKQIIWKSIDTQFYRFPYDKTATLEHANKRFTYKFLNYSASILTIPYMDFGESIKPGSVEITASGFNLTDDKNGNLYDVSLSTGSYSDRYNLVAYWGFNNEFRKTKNIGHESDFSKVEIPFESGIFQPDYSSVARNVHFIPGILLNETASSCALHVHESSILTPNRNEFNFTKNDDFTLSVWALFAPQSTGSRATIISKNSIIIEQVQGILDKPNKNNLIVPTFHVSTSTSYKPTDVFPYRLDVNPNGRINFERSDGISTLQLSGSTNLDDSNWHHFAVVKTGSNVILYEDGVAIRSGSDIRYNCHNRHSLMFGSDSLDGSINTFYGSFDEFRIYNKGLSPSTIATLADSSSLGAYQSSIVGNVFYRSGNVVVSSHHPKYNKLFSEPSWTLRYRGTHTIYTYEMLCRIPAGSFNLSLNSTWLKDPFSDLIIDQATGSLQEGALFPFATTIGYYNDARELIAVAKLNQPLQMRDDVNLNIIAQIDI